MTARVAIVTGASGGSGLGITRTPLERGYRVVANSRTISDSSDLFAEIFGSQAGHVRPLVVDTIFEIAP